MTTDVPVSTRHLLSPVTGRAFPLYPNGTVDYNSFSTMPPETLSPRAVIASGVYSSPETVFGVLVTFSLCTVFGNTLVMLAVKREHYLQSPPNYFVASLAAADFFVGVLLIPFEAITQLLNREWIFGDIWCDLWHSFDVLFATASILNLCVISLDRYWAICTPFSYSRRMTSKRAYRFIALVWICAIVISLPAIFWWRSVREGPVPPGTCPFTEDVGYLISSSCISFYMPLSVMLFAYYKIYLAAVKQSKSIQQGAKLFAHENGTEITLRMHRGGSNSNGNSSSGGQNANGAKSPSALPPQKSILFGRSDPSGLSILNCSAAGTSSSVKAVSYTNSSHFGRRNKGKRTFSEPSAPPERKLSPQSPGVIPSMSDDENPDIMLEESKVSAAVHLISQPLLMITTAAGNSKTNNTVTYDANSSSSASRGGNSNVPSVTFRNTRRSFTVARKLAKFAKEKKAAKTLAIVLGVFIICWLPFFVINIVFALCKSCAEGHMVTFEVVTWLGWINSAMNPVIYACWSHDFRRAFARLLCCGRCARARRQRQSQRRLSVV